MYMFAMHVYAIVHGTIFRHVLHFRGLPIVRNRIQTNSYPSCFLYCISFFSFVFSQFIDYSFVSFWFLLFFIIFLFLSDINLSLPLKKSFRKFLTRNQRDSVFFFFFNFFLSFFFLAVVFLMEHVTLHDVIMTYL